MGCHFDLECCQKKGSKEIKSLIIATCVAFFFMAIEFFGGMLANSLALISDALHMFTDVGAFLLSLIALAIAKRPRGASMTYGYKRAEILGALGNSVTLILLSGVIIYEAIHRFYHPRVVNGMLVMIIAVIGLCSNIYMIFILKSHAGHSLNTKAVLLHVIGDLLGSIGVIISGLIIWLTGWNIVDPIISSVFSLIILLSAVSIIKRSIYILMEGAPKDIDQDALIKDLLEIPGITEVVDLHLWSITTGTPALSVTILSTQDLSATRKTAQELLFSKYKIHHSTIEVDPA